MITTFSPTTFSNCSITISRRVVGSNTVLALYGPVVAFLSPPLRNAWPTQSFSPLNSASSTRQQNLTPTASIYTDVPPLMGSGRSLAPAYVPKVGDLITVTGSPKMSYDGEYAVTEVPRPAPSPFSGLTTIIGSYWEFRVRELTPETTYDTTPNTNDDSGTVSYL